MPPQQSSHGRSLVVLFAVAAFSNAALLFSVEPMFAKMLLPMLGGTPSVWNTALVFFQAVLLVGYGYAHLTTRLLPPRRQLALHAVLLLLSGLALPLKLRLPGDPPGGDAAIPWLVLALTMSLAFPFMMLSSGAPLLQRWFALSRHADAANPYFLYAASNLGSLCALVSYPLLIEPWFTLATQRGAWSVAYVAAMLVISLCALRVGQARRVATPYPNALDARIDGPIGAHVDDQIDGRVNGQIDQRIEVPKATTRDKLAWVVYSAVPSSLLLGVTSYVSTDLASVPLLWVVPLALYLLTFVLTFAARPFPHAWMVRVEPYLLILAVLQVYWSAALPGLQGVAFHFVLFFVIAMVCHGELSRRRPPAAQLTEFFLWISVGGLLGGVFNALLAPMLFDRVVEYAAVLDARRVPETQHGRDDEQRDTPPRRLQHAGRTGAVRTTASRCCSARPRSTSGRGETSWQPSRWAVAGIVLLSTASRPRRFGLALTAVVGAALFRDQVTPGAQDLLTERSFFGVYRVREIPGAIAAQLIHGTTLHGAQSLEPSRRLYPLTYYHRAGPMGDVFGMPPAAARRRAAVGIIGLGIGSSPATAGRASAGRSTRSTHGASHRARSRASSRTCATARRRPTS